MDRYYFKDGEITENISKADKTVFTSTKEKAEEIAAGKGDVVKIECYGEIEYMLREEAISYYTEGAVFTEGAEQERYITIVTRLKEGKKSATDRTLPNQVYTERGMVWVVDEYDTKEEIKAHGFASAFYSEDLGRRLYSRIVGENRREFAYVV